MLAITGANLAIAITGLAIFLMMLWVAFEVVVRPAYVEHRKGNSLHLVCLIGGVYSAFTIMSVISLVVYGLSMLGIFTAVLWLLNSIMVFQRLRKLARLEKAKEDAEKAKNEQP